MMEAALNYAKLGFSVIPMKEKTPLIKFADCPPLTEEEIHKYWTMYPFANIAVKTDKFFVIDIDRHSGGDDGFKSIALYEHPEQFKQTMFQKTPNGGEQLFYFKKDGFPKNQAISWLPGVDVKAHHNNYVMVPPSQTSKGFYEWCVVEKGNEVLTPTSIVTADSELIKAVSKREENHAFKRPNFKPNFGYKNKTTELFETVAEGFGSKNSGRNDRLAKFVGGLLLRGVEEERVRSLSYTTNQNSIDPLPQKEVEATVNSIIKKHYREKGAVSNH
ncbi:bifunctional DNA primase/polymerase [Enterococcus ratti]|nr:bifunctional DNA primase/polymerase [Enterococcus ratti]